MPVVSPYGRDNAAVLFGLAAIAALVGGSLGGIASWIGGVVAGALVGLTLWFFRDPDRAIPAEAQRDGVVLSPADGRVVQIVRLQEPEFLGEEAVQVSIFLSPLDVHVNRVPVSGIVRFLRYVPGRFFAAYRPEASRQNEQTLIGVETPCGKVLFKQIAGVLARRIVCTLQEGQRVQAGERFGMMKFGSRMDVLLPALRAELCVREGMRVWAGQTILGYLIPESAGLSQRDT
ncbi:Phosphatidylserine decarboxylase proenzyme [bacterium HR21]|nr:Phosphatidylserine decarboxylase proenzyme [bacterium HR21]